METLVIKRKRDHCAPESEMKYRQNKRILNEGFNALSLNRYTAITDVDDLNGNGADEECSPPPANARRRRSSFSRDSHVEEDRGASPPVEEEFMLSVIKGGQKKYLRKVDFMVDELIRKSSRNEFSPRGFVPKDFDSQIPASVGPSPRVDTALSSPLWLVSYLENGGKLEMPSQGSLALTNGSMNDDVGEEKRGCAPAGDTTHADWGIIELPHVSASSSRGITVAEHHESLKRSYYSNHSASTSSASVEHVGCTASTPNQIKNNGFKNIHTTVHDELDSSGDEHSEDGAMQQDGQEGEDEDDDELCRASTDLQRSRSRGNSVDSVYSAVTGLSELSDGQANPYYVDPDDNVYFMLDGDITATPHKRRVSRGSTQAPGVSRGSGTGNGKPGQRYHLSADAHFSGRDRGAAGDDVVSDMENEDGGGAPVRRLYQGDSDVDPMCDDHSAGGFGLHYNHSPRREQSRDLGTVVTGDAIYCID